MVQNLRVLFDPNQIESSQKELEQREEGENHRRCNIVLDRSNVQMKEYLKKSIIVRGMTRQT
jgi:hypothetical protein